MKQAVLLAAGPISHPEQLTVPEKAFLVCADAGYRYAQALGREPDLILGDFDSAPAPDSPAERLTFPVEKNDTDTMLAIKELYRRGYRKLTIYGGTHGRLDHTFANLQSLSWAARHGMEVELVDEVNRVQVFLPGRYTIPKGDYPHFSLFSLSPETRGVTLTGAYYPCENLTLSRLFPLGVSNHLVEETASLTFTAGELLCIQSKAR